ncbi:pentatricopeptide repeat-containing protein At5g66520-like [Telopea speciosissima]|uniref:pentatricopeptide repeat-containing protein At5g66520-like n=1 Tax=Telopea speciosissima TaxID=54955 RepID=UPI001CC78362|nr:pentatricopeptide repeat-containing protein At5g66520-like [Telopea speciosissima]
MNVSLNLHSLAKPVQRVVLGNQQQLQSPAQQREKRQSPQKKTDAAISLLQLCKNSKELVQVHSLLIKTSLIREKHAFGRLLSFFAASSEPGTLDYAQRLFDNVDFPRNSFIYNTMIKAYLIRGNPRISFLVYYQMLCEGSIFPDEFTFTFVFAACSKLSSVSEGKQAHAQMVKYPLRFGTQSWNSLLDFYAKIREMGSLGQRLFDQIEEPDIISWNCLLDGFVKSGELDAARAIFDVMPQRDTVSWTSMLVGFANAGLMSEASKLFDNMPERNLVSWSAMISACVQMGRYREGLDLFKQMQVAGIKTDKITMTTLLSACARLGALDQGQWFHAYIDKYMIEIDAHLSTALVDMYAKCGKIDIALKVFRRSGHKKVFLWNAILGGLAMHSRGREAVELLSEMLEEGIKPNQITFLSVLAACSHSGLVDDGLRIFHIMMNDHNIRLTMAHYGCIVDLYARAGLLNDAKRFIETMPMEADGSVWRALLGACRLHGNVNLGEHIGRILLELEPSNDGNYVLLSDIYAIGKRWEDVGKLRREMKVSGVRKMPGCSSIELNGVIHEFVAGDGSHPESLKIYRMLDEMAPLLGARHA